MNPAPHYKQGFNPYVGSLFGAAMAMAGSALPVLSQPQRIYPPKVYPQHIRHQGKRECARRLRRG